VQEDIMRSTTRLKLVMGAVLAVTGLLVFYPYLRSELAPTPAEASDRNPAWLGVNLQDLTPDLREGLHIDRRVRGALVTSVTAGSPADRAGIRSEDVITELDGRRVGSVDDVLSEMRSLEAGQKVLVVVNRGGSSRGLSAVLADRDRRWMDSRDESRDSDREVRRYYSRGGSKDRDWRKPRIYFDEKPRGDRDSGDRDEARAPKSRSRRDRAWEDDDRAPEIVWHDRDGERHVLRFRSEDGKRRVIILGGDDEDEIAPEPPEAPVAPEPPRAPRAERPRVHVFRGHDDGERSERGFLGVSTMSLGEQLADYFGVHEDEGVLVTRVEEDSPADRAGFRAGDVILSVEGESISSPSELRRAIRDHHPEDTVAIEVVRRGDRRTLRATLGDASDYGALDLEGAFPGPLGIEIPPIHIEGLENLKLPDLEDLDLPDIEINGRDFNQQYMKDLRRQLREESRRLREELRKIKGDVRRQIREDRSGLREEGEARRAALESARGALRESKEAQREALRQSREALERARKAMEADRRARNRRADGTI
jgi:membrane-associated protease RseP (regulator of RpoE activity)